MSGAHSGMDIEGFATAFGSAPDHWFDFNLTEAGSRGLGDIMRLAPMSANTFRGQGSKSERYPPGSKRTVIQMFGPPSSKGERASMRTQ